MVLVISSRDDVFDSVAVAVGKAIPTRQVSETGLLTFDSSAYAQQCFGVVIDFRDNVNERRTVVDQLVRSSRGPGVVAIVEEKQTSLIFELARRGVHGLVSAPPAPAVMRKTLERVVAETSLTAEISGSSPRVLESGIVRTALAPLAGTSDASRSLRRSVIRVARSDMPVLLVGDTGAGKQIVARAIHDISARRSRRFVDINVSVIAETVFESEFFGSVTGAFTGACNRPGHFSYADGGTLFLDEIGDLPLQLQPKILKAVETGHVNRVGSEKSQRADVRLICATNRHLDRMVQLGTFRQDLWNRIAAFVIRVPTLRDRLEDMPFLVKAILNSAEKSSVVVRPDAILALQHHQWRGNVRELKLVLERSILLSGRTVLRARDLAFNPDVARFQSSAEDAVLSDL